MLLTRSPLYSGIAPLLPFICPHLARSSKEEPFQISLKIILEVYSKTLQESLFPNAAPQVLPWGYLVAYCLDVRTNLLDSALLPGSLLLWLVAAAL